MSHSPSAANGVHPFDLQAAARETMHERGFQPDFGDEVKEQLEKLKAHPPSIAASGEVQDLRSLLWSSIDNDTSRDLDQIEIAERLANGEGRVRIAIADVDAFVPLGSPIDKHAARETTTVYTGVHNFSMLPEVLSTGLTSLLPHQDCLAVVYDFTVDSKGCVSSSSIYRAAVNNKAQLTYNAVGAWLEGRGAPPPPVAASAALQAQLKLQDEIAQCLRQARYERGALDIETIETHPVILKQEIVDIAPQLKNHATELIEDFMVAANGVVARTLEKSGMSSIRRIVKIPKRWDRIVELASQSGTLLPAEPDSKALSDFLTARKAADPTHFPDLSLAVVKLLGPGEYVLERPGDPPQGHFGLAVQDYTHSTAPNRRFADLVTQRLIKAHIAGNASPYSDSDLAAIAQNCTLKEDAERKVERDMQKRIAAVAMRSKVGQTFDAIVTGVNHYGSFVRVLNPHMEGKLVRGGDGVDVGDRIEATLIHTDPVHGFIDFARS